MSEAPRKHTLVTGAAGSLASSVIERLKRTCDIVAVDFRHKVDFGPDIPSYKIDFSKRSFEDLFRHYHFDSIVHLGRIGAHESSMQSRFNANVVGTQRLLDLAKKYEIKSVVVLSTYFVYGAHPYNPSLIQEDSPLKASGLTRDLVDSVELENLCQVYLWKHPDLHITILRPCNVAGPGVKNSLSRLLSGTIAPVLSGYSPMMQFIHVEDMADATVLAFEKNKPGIYNVAPNDYIPYQDALVKAGCTRLPLWSIPPAVPAQISNWLNWNAFPSYLMNYFRYPVIIDGSHFVETFGFEPKRTLKDIFGYYRGKKKGSFSFFG
jgi:UDP-glucose 4-epimerase